MIQLKSLFKPVKGMDSVEAKAFIEEQKEGTFTIVDVRQPGEYEQSRIPGATLIPLPELHDSLSKLDPGRPTLVY